MARARVFAGRRAGRSSLSVLHLSGELRGRLVCPSLRVGACGSPAVSPSPGVHLQGDPLPLTLAPTHCRSSAGCPVALPCLPLSHFEFHLWGLPVVCRQKSGTQGPPHRGSPLLNTWHYFQTFIHLLLLTFNHFFQFRKNGNISERYSAGESLL